MKKTFIAVFFTAMFTLFAYLIVVNKTSPVYDYSDIDSLISIGIAKPLGSPDTLGVYRQGVLIDNYFYRPYDVDSTYVRAQTSRFRY